LALRFGNQDYFFGKVMAPESANGGPHDEVKTATIRTFSSHQAAELAAANLEAHGIRCWINADDCGGMLPNLTTAGGVRLLVRISDTETAIALLDAQVLPTEIDQMETETAAVAASETIPRKKLALGQIFIGIVVGVILCLLYQWNSKLGTKTYYHYTADGKRDEAWVYRDGHLAEHLQDRNLDGVWDYWAYHEHGVVVRSELDNNFDGRPDETWTYSNGDLVSMEKDTDFNGVPDEFCTFKYHILQQEDMKPNGSKFATEREIFRNGVLTEIWRGGDSNGNFKEVVRYDPFFNPISTNIPTAFQLLSPSAK
jgi:hypothetical protein